MSLLPKSVVVTDDTMREGLQIESPDIPVDDKLRLLDALGETGAKVISIGSFAHPKWVPSMACIEEIAERFVPKPGIKYTAAVFNRKGFERADKFYPKIDVRGRRGFGSFVELCDTFARRNPADMPFVETLPEAAHFRNGPSVYEGRLCPWKDGDALIR